MRNVWWPWGFKRFISLKKKHIYIIYIYNNNFKTKQKNAKCENFVVKCPVAQY